MIIPFRKKENIKTVQKPKLIMIGALAVCAVLILLAVLVRSGFRGFDVVYADPNENVLAYRYYPYSSGILKVASDNTSYINDKNEVYWTASYNMTNPRAVFCKDVAAVYDYYGNSVVICNSRGPFNSVTTAMPIIKASVSKDGSTAVITDDGTNAWIEYFDKTGARISSVKTTMDATGYPYDAALSPRGNVLAVSYITYEDSQMTSRICFYNFAEAGRESADNIVSSFTYSGLLMTEIEYIGSDTLVAFTEEGAKIFKGADIPSEKRNTKINGDILSVFTGPSYYGFVYADPNSQEQKIAIYSPSGHKKADKGVEIAYTTIVCGTSDIVLHNGSQIFILSPGGRKKLEFISEERLRSLVPAGGNRYAMTTENEFRLAKLK